MMPRDGSRPDSYNSGRSMRERICSLFRGNPPTRPPARPPGLALARDGFVAGFASESTGGRLDGPPLTVLLCASFLFFCGVGGCHPSMQLFKVATPIIENNFPETQHATYVLPCNGVIMMAWKVRAKCAAGARASSRLPPQGPFRAEPGGLLTARVLAVRCS